MWNLRVEREREKGISERRQLKVGLCMREDGSCKIKPE
jgi:hypothetical protein